jgi:hypothetical protein
MPALSAEMPDDSAKPSKDIHDTDGYRTTRCERRTQFELVTQSLQESRTQY